MDSYECSVSVCCRKVSESASCHIRGGGKEASASAQQANRMLFHASKVPRRTPEYRKETHFRTAKVTFRAKMPQKEGLTRHMNLQKIEDAFKSCADFARRTLPVGKKTVTVLYIEGICDRKFVHDYILNPLIGTDPAQEPNLHHVLTGGRLTDITDDGEAVRALLNGNAVVSDGTAAVAIPVQNEISRGINEPETETVIRGPREGFTENAFVNAALLRRRIRSSSLKMETMTAGDETNTQLILMYMENLAAPKVLNCVRQRLSGIRTGNIFGSGTVEIYLQDGKAPLFPTVGNSERPDKVASKLLEGRVAVIVDGSPVVLTVPCLFAEALQSSEDYAKSPYFASFLRLLRFSSLLSALFLPAVFVALMYFHQTVIPLSLLQKISESRSALPIPLFWETVFSLLSFEIIREVGIRMPRSVGGAVSLAAALILGDSAIEAGIASAPVIIVTAFSAICNFAVPPLTNALTVSRFLLLLAARLMGLYGIGILTILMLIHLCAKESCSVPYFSPFAPVSGTGLLDFLIMAPIWSMKKVPPAITGKNITRAHGKRTR